MFAACPPVAVVRRAPVEDPSTQAGVHLAAVLRLHVVLEAADAGESLAALAAHHGPAVAAIFAMAKEVVFAGEGDPAGGAAVTADRKRVVSAGRASPRVQISAGNSSRSLGLSVGVNLFSEGKRIALSVCTYSARL